MKTTIILLFALTASTSLFARKDSVIIRDAWRQRNAVERQRVQRDSTAEMEIPEFYTPVEGELVVNPPKPIKPAKPHARNPKAHWDGFYLGFTKFLNNGWTDYEGEIELDWARSFTMHFNLSDFVLASSTSARRLLVTGIGLEYNRLYFDREITVRREDGEFIVKRLSELGVTDPRRSVFKALYLTVPLLAEFQSPNYKGHLSIGLVGGTRLHSKTKIVHDARGDKRKIKQTSSYGMYPFKVDLTAHVGFKGFTIWATKSLTPMFGTNGAPRVYPFTLGFGFGD